ncbi:TetR/AcrR family transcriptional regulator [Pseudonocardia sp. CA-107938]|uniref:TetR/AcrR family transcriptional regulator n=1 Tax=Pseudonocardia sp. CA-107938 TaxID=3240021 RepID=UPI003D8EC97B
MPRRTARSAPTRPSAAGAPRLSRDRIVATAVALADREGVAAVSMRRLGQELGVDPMSLYHHVEDKEVLIDAMVDQVVAEIPRAERAGSWADALRATVLAARATLLRHPWAARVIATRPAPTPAALRHIDTVLDILRGGGFSLDLCHHALHVLGSRVLGFSQDLFDDSAAADAPPPPPEWAAHLPRVAELAAAARHDGALGGCDDEAEFAFGLDLILDGLERRRTGR